MAVKEIKLNSVHPNDPMSQSKKLQKEKERQEKVLKEISSMKKLQHDDVVQYFGSCLSNDGHSLFIFMELMHHSVDDLLEEEGPFVVSRIRNFAKQILTGLLFIHDEGFIHRDLKGKYKYP